MARKSRRSQNPLENKGFQTWLQQFNLSRKQLNNPAVMQKYYEDWELSLQSQKSKRKGLFSSLSLPKVSLDQISENVGRVNEILSTMKDVQNVMGPFFNKKPKHFE